MLTHRIFITHFVHRVLIFHTFCFGTEGIQRILGPPLCRQLAIFVKLPSWIKSRQIRAHLQMNRRLITLLNSIIALNISSLQYRPSLVNEKGEETLRDAY